MGYPWHYSLLTTSPVLLVLFSTQSCLVIIINVIMTAIPERVYWVLLLRAGLCAWRITLLVFAFTAMNLLQLFAQI